MRPAEVAWCAASPGAARHAAGRGLHPVGTHVPPPWETVPHGATRRAQLHAGGVPPGRDHCREACAKSAWRMSQGVTRYRLHVGSLRRRRSLQRTASKNPHGRPRALLRCRAVRACPQAGRRTTLEAMPAHEACASPQSGVRRPHLGRVRGCGARADALRVESAGDENAHQGQRVGVDALAAWRIFQGLGLGLNGSGDQSQYQIDSTGG